MVEFCSFFSGPSLSVTEQACLASFVAHGHMFRLYAYDSLQVPPGVELADAALIIPVAEHDAFFSMATGQVQFRRITQFANGFRYRLLRDHGGWWVDTDVLCLSSDIPQDDLVFAWEIPDVIGTAILKFPRGHPVMSDALTFWYGNQSVTTFGHTGPYLFTRLIREHGLTDVAAQVRTIYPIPPADALATWDPTRRAEVESLITGKPFLHLWNTTPPHLRLGRNCTAPRGSFLRAMIDTHLGDAYRDSLDDLFVSTLLAALLNQTRALDESTTHAHQLSMEIAALKTDRDHHSWRRWIWR